MYPSLWKVPGDLFADFDQIQRQFDAAFGPSGWPPGIRALQRGAFPAINMGSSAEAVEIYAFAPGLDPAKIEVTVDKGLLTLAGERGSDVPARGNTGAAEGGAKSADKRNVYARERFSGAFRRVISLPDDVDPSRVDATYRDGVLRISVAKREASKPRRIEVQGSA